MTGPFFFLRVCGLFKAQSPTRFSIEAFQMTEPMFYASERGAPPDFSGRGPAFLRSAALFPVVKCVEVYACQIDRLTKAQNGQISSPQNTWGYSCEVVAKSYPIRIVIQFSRCNEKTFHLFPLGSAELSGVYENFLSGKKPSHLFGIAKPNDTLFHRKNKKIFFPVAGALFCLPRKSLLTYSH